MGLRGALRGRGRGAAGSRGAGNATRGGYVPGFMGRGYRRYDTEVSTENITFVYTSSCLPLMTNWDSIYFYLCVQKILLCIM